MINTPSAIVLGMVYNFLPFMVLPIYNVLSKIDDNIINAAMDLGANSFQRFTRIWFPLSIPGIISGITMVFVPSLVLQRFMGVSINIIIPVIVVIAVVYTMAGGIKAVIWTDAIQILVSMGGLIAEWFHVRKEQYRIS